MSEIHDVKSAFAQVALAFTAQVGKLEKQIEKLQAELAAERDQSVAERRRWQESYDSLKASYDNEFANTERLLEELRRFGANRERQRLV